MDNKILNYYLRKDIQTAIVQAAHSREIGVMFGKGNFGKRPDMLQYESDVKALALKGATSFHMSEERWSNPLELTSGGTRKDLDNLRVGFDVILDIDSDFFEFSRATALLIFQAFEFHNLQHYSVKFSGRSGFHIGIPFEAFPQTVNNMETKLLFPDSVRVIAAYIKSIIKPHLAKQILAISSPEDIAQHVNKPLQELMDYGSFDPFSVVDIDSVAISSRHMIRSPYSVNEKSGLASIPMSPEQVKTFKLSQAKLENVQPTVQFLDTTQIKEPEAAHLIIQAFDWQSRNIKRESYVPEASTEKKTYQAITEKVTQDLFPPCMKLTLKGLPSDGRKRAVFMLINFLRNAGYSLEETEEELMQWNKKNYEPLREGYIKAQLYSAKKKPELILPPNCDNKAYAPDLGVCKPDNFCSKIKNPVQYVSLRLRLLSQNKRTKRKTVKKTIKKKAKKQANT